MKVISLLLIALLLISPAYAELQDVSGEVTTEYADDIITALNQINSGIDQMSTETRLTMENGLQSLASAQRINNIKFLVGMFAVILSALIIYRLIGINFAKKRDITKQTALKLDENVITAPKKVEFPKETKKDKDYVELVDQEQPPKVSEKIEDDTLEDDEVKDLKELKELLKLKKLLKGMK